VVFSTALVNHLPDPWLYSLPDADDKQKTINSYDLTWMFKPSRDAFLSIKVYQTNNQLAFMENTTTFSKSVHTTKAIGADLQGNYQFLENLLGLAGFNYVINTNASTDTGITNTSSLAGFSLGGTVGRPRKLPQINTGARVE
jgi:hypothetical protein